jgi:hypothetical protein
MKAPVEQGSRQHSTGLTKALAVHIISRLGEAGQPPELGINAINVGNDSYLDVIEDEYLRPIVRDGRGSSFKLVQAYFGGGKTHFLFCVRERAWALGFPTALVGLSPDECPFDDPVRIYAAVAREIAWPPLDPTIAPSRGIDELLRTVLDLKLATTPAEALQEWIIRHLRRVPADSHSYRVAVARFLLAQLEEDMEAEDVLAAFLRGEHVTPAELRTYGVREEIRKETGFRFLRSMVQVIQALGAPGVVLEFDEMDRNLSFSPSRRRAIVDNLRQMIDLCGREALSGMLMLYAVPPEFLTRIVPEYVALQQRLESPSTLSVRSPQAVVIDLETLDVPQSQLLANIGERILDVFSHATEAELRVDVQRKNLATLAKVVIERAWDVAHRRTFVKGAVALLYDQIGPEGERELTEGAVRTFAERAGAEAPAHDDFEDF